MKEEKYAATYRFPGSKAVVHIVAPPPMTEEEKEKILQEYDRAFLELWNTLSVEQQLQINAESAECNPHAAYKAINKQIPRINRI